MPKTEIERLLDDLHSNLVVTASKLARQIDESGSSKEKANVIKRLTTINNRYTELIHASTDVVTGMRQAALEIEGE